MDNRFEGDEFHLLLRLVVTVLPIVQMSAQFEAQPPVQAVYFLMRIAIEVKMWLYVDLCG